MSLRSGSNRLRLTARGGRRAGSSNRPNPLSERLRDAFARRVTVEVALAGPNRRPLLKINNLEEDENTWAQDRRKADKFGDRRHRLAALIFDTGHGSMTRPGRQRCR